MRQASRRSWRIGQRLPVRVVYLAYRGTLQTQALTLVAKKLQASLAVEGEVTAAGLASFGDDGEDLLLALARSLTEQVEASEDSLEGLFAGSREAERENEVVLGAETSEANWESEPIGATPEREEKIGSLQSAPVIRLIQPQQDEPLVPEAAGEQLRLF
jgi:hypothetical protein